MTEEQERLVSEAFSKQSETFDDSENENIILQQMRKDIRDHLLSLLQPGNKILELNAGTGLDAIYFAQHGMNILATDNADGMVKEINKKVTFNHLENNVEVKKCSFNDLKRLKPEKFDYIFSNFGGLNCTDNIQSVIQQFDELLNPNGFVTLILMPPVCLWELLSVFKGNFNKAFRRFKSNGTESKIEGIHFKTYYYSPKFILEAFGKEYKMIALYGLCVISPPPYKAQFAIKYPKLHKALSNIDNTINDIPPFRSWADHYIITMQKK